MPQPFPNWTAPYMGRRFSPKGRGPELWDCWGHYRDLAAARLGLDLPAFTEGYGGTKQADRDDIARLIAHGESDWQPIWIRDQLAPNEPMLRELAQSRWQEGDCLKFRIFGRPMHVAYLIKPHMALHIYEGANSAGLYYDQPEWASLLLGLYRHRSLCNGAASVVARPDPPA